MPQDLTLPTVEELDAWIAAEAAATKGEWQVERNHDDIVIGVSSPSQTKHDLDFILTDVTEQDADFIALMRNNWVRLVAAARRGIPQTCSTCLLPLVTHCEKCDIHNPADDE